MTWESKTYVSTRLSCSWRHRNLPASTTPFSAAAGTGTTASPPVMIAASIISLGPTGSTLGMGLKSVIGGIVVLTTGSVPARDLGVVMRHDDSQCRELGLLVLC